MFEVSKVLELENADAVNLAWVLHDVLLNETEKIRKLPAHRVRRAIDTLSDYMECDSNKVSRRLKKEVEKILDGCLPPTGIYKEGRDRVLARMRKRSAKKKT